VHDQLESIFFDISGPLVQLVVQEYLCATENKPIHSKDVLAVTNRLIAALGKYGLELVGTMGETHKFDPTSHEPLSLEDKIAGGDQVIVRMVGLSFEGKILRRAAVTLLV